MKSKTGGNGLTHETVGVGGGCGSSLGWSAVPEAGEAGEEFVGEPAAGGRHYGAAEPPVLLPAAAGVHLGAADVRGALLRPHWPHSSPRLSLPQPRDLPQPLARYRG